VAVFSVKRTSSNSGGASHCHAVLALSRLFELVVAWNRRSRDWYLLAGLDERNLRDIGIDSSMLGRDDTASFWRLRHGLELSAGADRRRGGHRVNEYLLL
jgi:hypothetical protein